MGYLLDLATAGVLILFLILGAKRGAVRSLLNLGSTVLVVFLSSWLGKLLAQFIYGAFIQKGLTDTIAKSLADNAKQAGTDTYVTSVLSSLPQYIRDSISALGIDLSSFTSSIDSTQSVNLWANSAAVQLEKLLAPIYTALISLVSVLALFIILMIFRKILVNIICKVFDLPVLKQVNGFVGAIVGLLEGVLFIFIICMVLHIMLPYQAEIPAIFSDSSINSTILFKQFYNCGIFSYFNTQARESLLSAVSSASSTVRR